MVQSALGARECQSRRRSRSSCLLCEDCISKRDVGRVSARFTVVGVVPRDDVNALGLACSARNGEVSRAPDTWTRGSLTNLNIVLTG